MDEADLRTFLVLCETQNTRDAAALLRVNQSNVSRALARLEVELGAELFTRRGRRLELNRTGAAFAADARQLVERFDTGRRHVAQLSGSAAPVRLGFLQSTARWAVPAMISAFRRRHPASRFELRQGFAVDLFGWIDADLLDVAFVTPPPEGAGIEWRQLVEQRLHVVVPAGHRLAGRSEVSAEELAGEEFIAFARSTELRTLTDRILAEAGIEVRIAFESSEIDTIRGLVGAGLGVAVLPEPATTDADHLGYVQLAPTRVRRLGLAWSGERANPASVRAFVELNTDPTRLVGGAGAVPGQSVGG